MHTNGWTRSKTCLFFLHFSFFTNKLRRETHGDRFPSKGIPRDDCKAVHYFTRSIIFLLICPPPIVRPTRFTFFEYGTTYYNTLWPEMGHRVRSAHMYILIWNGWVTMNNRRDYIVFFFSRIHRRILHNIDWLILNIKWQNPRRLLSIIY